MRAPTRNRRNKLERWEVALVKQMIATMDVNDQDILAYFTRPSRSINHARIAEIRGEAKHRSVNPASTEQLNAFLLKWPNIDPSTGLHVEDDELLIKAREAMLHAVQCYNNPRTVFKAEVFIVVSVISWTYLLHWYYRKEEVDIRYKDRDGEVLKTRHGAEKHWELEACLDHATCPVDEATKTNLKFLIALRHEIEHQMTRRIDDTISAKLQACCLNFNRSIKSIAGVRFGLDGDLSFSLQFSTIDTEQRDILLSETNLPANIIAMQTEFENDLAEAVIRNPHYAYRVAYIEKSVNSKGKADKVVEFIRASSAEGEEISRILLKDTEKPKFKPAQIVRAMSDEGFPNFKVHHHSQLWKDVDGKNPAKGYGVSLNGGDWWWYQTWVDRVRHHCEENRAQYE